MYAAQTNVVQATVILWNHLKHPLYGFKKRIFQRSTVEIGSFNLHKSHRSSSFYVGTSFTLRNGGLRKMVPRMSKGNGHKLTVVSESSESANEEILFFFFQLDLSTRIQCALNTDDYQLVQHLQTKLFEIEQEAARQRRLKRGLPLPKDEAQDAALTIMRLRTDLRKAIDNEDYTSAAELRDKISKLQGDSLAAEARALVYQNMEYAFRLGQKVRHALLGYRGVICGMDPYCCESSSWIQDAGIDKLSRGRNQPFYLVLVDVHVTPKLLVAYA
eukprot:TRINITY_DN716_c0_g2_i3.p1 TRINITY_DN716_c0_g2~~TRINITY_DN716_c0_g2_i3.p1  ORF type:complete len:273 (+),score=46.32 TRINITY_DN716_c0_g2_i3:449-1267(+)